MARLYALLSWILVALGLLHVGSSVRFYQAISLPALWFVSGGLLILLGAILNLLNRSYGRQARGLRVATVFTNIVMAGVATAGGVLSRASAVQLLLVLGTYAAITALSCSRRVLL
jgi:hypothetical protein